VELTVEKADGSLAFVDAVNGGLSKQGKVGAGLGVCSWLTEGVISTALLAFLCLLLSVQAWM
jgi:hypothetical protein